MLTDNEAFHRDQASIKRVQRVLEHTTTWAEAGDKLQRSGTLQAVAPTALGRTTSSLSSVSSAGVFAALHRVGMREWVVGRRSSTNKGGSAEEEEAAAALAAALGRSGSSGVFDADGKIVASSSTAATSRRSTQEAGVRRLLSHQQRGGRSSGGRASDTADGKAEPADNKLVASVAAGGEGPLSRSLTTTRQRNAAAMESMQMVGRALHQVLEGEREGAESPSPMPSPQPLVSRITSRGRQLLLQLHSRSEGAGKAAQTQPEELASDSASNVPNRQQQQHQQQDDRRASGTLQLPPVLERSSLIDVAGSLAGLTVGTSSSLAVRPSRSARASASDAGESEGGGLAGSLAGRGPLMHSMQVRQSMSLSQLLGSDEEAFQKLLAGTLKGDTLAQQQQWQRQPFAAEGLLSPRQLSAGPGETLQGGLLASLSPWSSVARSVQHTPVGSATAGAAASTSPSPSRRISQHSAAAAPSGEPPIYAWGSGLASMLSTGSMHARMGTFSSAGGSAARGMSAPGMPPVVEAMAEGDSPPRMHDADPHAAHAAPQASFSGDLETASEADEATLLEFELLDHAVAQAMMSHEQVDQIERRLDLPQTASMAAPVQPAAARTTRQRRRLWAQDGSAELQTLAGSSNLQSQAVSPTRHSLLQLPPAVTPPIMSPSSNRRHTVAHMDPHHQHRHQEAAAQQGVGMDVLGRRATAPEMMHAAAAAAAAALSPLSASRQGSMMAPCSPMMAPIRQQSIVAGGPDTALMPPSRQQSTGLMVGGSAAPLPKRSMNLEDAYRVSQRGELNPLRAGLQRPHPSGNGGGGTTTNLPPRPPQQQLSRSTSLEPAAAPATPGPLLGGHRAVAAALAHGTLSTSASAALGPSPRDALRRSPSTGWEALGLPSGPGAPLADPTINPANNTNKYAQSWFGSQGGQSASRQASMQPAITGWQRNPPQWHHQPPGPRLVSASGGSAGAVTPPQSGAGTPRVEASRSRRVSQGGDGDGYYDHRATPMASPPPFLARQPSFQQQQHHHMMSPQHYSPAPEPSGGHVITAVDIARRATESRQRVRSSSLGGSSPGVGGVGPDY